MRYPSVNMLFFWLAFTFLTLFLTIDPCCCLKYPEDEVHYFLYDKRIDDWTEMWSNRSSPRAWVYGAPVKVLVHGLNSHPDRTPFQVIKHHYLFIVAKEYRKMYNDINIIVVDWTDLSTAKPEAYSRAAANTYVAGNELAHFLVDLERVHYFPGWRNVHLIGHSLGAHVCGVAGYFIRELLKGIRVGRITGLDPAGPEFQENDGYWPRNMTRVLDFSDATFVDVIHSNMGPKTDMNWVAALGLGTYGSSLLSAHVDFVVNGGEHMPQCGIIADRAGTCSHQMSVLYFAYALRYHKEPKKFCGCPCDSVVHFLLGLCKCSYSATIAIGEFTKPVSDNNRQRVMLNLRDKIDKYYFGWKEGDSM